MTEKLTFGCKNILLYSKGRWIWHKNIVKPLKPLKIWTKIKMVFLRKDVNSPRNDGNGIIYAILREKKEFIWKVNILLPFSFIFIQNMEMKGKYTEKSFFLKKYIFFQWNGLYYIFVTWKRDFLQNVVKTNKKV